MEDSKPRIEKLSGDTIEAAVAVGDKTKSGDISFDSSTSIEIVQTKLNLEALCEPLLKAFIAMKKVPLIPLPEEIMTLTDWLLPQQNSPASQTRVTMIHIQKDTSTMLPVDVGWEVDLIPVRQVGGQPSVGGEELGLGHYAHLTKSCEVTGDMYAVLVLWEID